MLTVCLRKLCPQNSFEHAYVEVHTPKYRYIGRSERPMRGTATCLVHKAQVEAPRTKWRYIGRFCTPTSALCTALPTFLSRPEVVAPRGNQVKSSPRTV